MLAKRRAQHFMPVDQCGEARMQQVRIERTAQVQPRGHVVRRETTARQLVHDPDTLLRERQRHLLPPFDNTDRCFAERRVCIAR
jgi:hypothetical protein